MEIEEIKEQAEEMNDENDAREEDIVKDTENDFDKVMEKLNAIYDEMDSMKNEMKALQHAQAVMVENGAVINDTDDVDDSISFGELKPVKSFDDIDFSI